MLTMTLKNTDTRYKYAISVYIANDRMTEYSQNP